ncbi:MAG: hypothetical protein CM15mP89_4470 [Gammaproteobacteria bacterium]|nr:MAG: hypothetical protein CM15mP89_4470 [Gammaproteobacteria bacterium]
MDPFSRCAGRIQRKVNKWQAPCLVASDWVRAGVGNKRNIKAKRPGSGL